MRTGPMTNIKTRRTSGFSMVELLIAVIIIGILVTIIVPVLTNRAADARIAAAKADMEAIAAAQSQVAIDTGYIVRLHVLDDSGAIGDDVGSDDPADVVDAIGDEEFNNGSNPDYIFLDAKTGVPVITGDVLFDRVKNNPEQFGWKGPYLSIQKKLNPIDDPPPPLVPWSYGAPLDPWGNPYFLFVAGPQRAGTGDPSGGFIDEWAIAPGAVSANFNYGAYTAIPAQQFDRNTLLSLGPNGAPGDGVTNILGTGDDLVRAF